MATVSAATDAPPQAAQAAPSPAPAPSPSPASPPRLSPTATSSSSSIASRSRFFTTASARPFSRSALQRQSVHTLPSIHHLQHGFAKLGLLAQADAQPRAAPPTRRTSSSSGTLQPVEQGDAVEGGGDVLEALGPQPDKPLVDLRMPWERDEAQTPRATLKDEAQLRDEAYDALEAVCDCWALARGPTRPPRRRPSSSTMSRNPSTSSSLAPLSPIDDPSLPFSIPDADLPLVPTLLATTTLAVRAIQAFAVSLPSTSTSAQLDNNKRGDDPLVVLRRMSLDVLGMLRELEARYRLPGATALEHDAAAVRAAGADDERRARAPPLGDVDPPHGPRPVAPDSPPAPQYRTDVGLLALDSEAALVERWVRAVEGELERSGVRGGAVRAGGGRRRSSVRGGGEGQEGEGAGAQDEGDGAVLPDWARETGWPDGLARAHAIMLAHASTATVEHALPDPADDRDGFLDALTDGTLLLESFNAVLRHSPLSRPFGFVPSTSIHAFPSLAITNSSTVGTPVSTSMSRTASTASDGGERVGATFRRAENLGQWSAALKHRYALTLGPPPFDARLVAARKPDSGSEWREMLAMAVEAWSEAVAREAREVQSERGRREGERRASEVNMSETVADV